ncbi:hypothetical protein IAG41_15895 [Sphingomonas sp. JC676]|uniref:hypothetical protein n=1 Tax=Sphingomonas sp. JC676 TaxID=2768065 RepID=UPI001657C8B5|nr:hypothetical protein [Sphingomonas sp. JC676]MBC9033878.1 hypothetical protein [Sphingomonas sp. JC676]
MTEANWGDGALSPEIDWRMSAALENVPRGDSDLAEVTSLAGAVIAWLELDPTHRALALLTPERALVVDGQSLPKLSGEAIAALAERLPAEQARARGKRTPARERQGEP